MQFVASGHELMMSQDRLGQHLAPGRDAIANAAKKVQDGAKRVQDGAKDALERR